MLGINLTSCGVLTNDALEVVIIMHCLCLWIVHCLNFLGGHGVVLLHLVLGANWAGVVRGSGEVWHEMKWGRLLLFCSLFLCRDVLTL